MSTGDRKSGQCKRVLVVGLDSATLDILDQWLVEGRLPTIQRLIQQGAIGRVRSTFPPMTPPAWTTLATGKQPGKHGIFEWVKREAGSYRLVIVTRDDWRAQPIWTLLSEAGYQVGIVNFPITYPPEAVNGFFVCGLNAPRGSVFCHPPEVFSVLNRDGPYDVHLIQVGEISEDRKRFLKTLYRMTERQTQALIRLGTSYEWDLLWTVYMGTDWVQHFFWREMEEGVGEHAHAIRDYYEFLDAQLGRLLSVLAPTSVVLVSDHGVGRVEELVYVNSLLEELGVLTRRGGSSSARSGLQVSQQVNQKVQFRARMARLVATTGLPARLPAALKRRLPAAMRLAPSLADGIDFTRTRAYSFGSYGGIYVNLKGREPQGTVASSEYGVFCDELITRLRAVRHPRTGEPVFSNVWHRCELYHGDGTAEAPDILLECRSPTINTYGGFGGNWLDKPLPGRTADHLPLGLIVLSGEAVQVGVELGVADASDVAPTLLYLLDQPIPNDMDGRVITEAFALSRLDAPPKYITAPMNVTAVTATHTLTTDEEEAVKKRLRDLGYLE